METARKGRGGNDGATAIVASAASNACPPWLLCVPHLVLFCSARAACVAVALMLSLLLTECLPVCLPVCLFLGLPAGEEQSLLEALLMMGNGTCR